MNIGFDATSLLFNRGVSRYTANVISAIAQLKSDTLFAYANTFKHKSIVLPAIAQLGVPTTNIHIDTLPTPIHELIWQLGRNSIKHTFPKIEVFHSWDWIQPPDKSLPLVSTIHDLAILKYPETAHPKILAHHKKSWEILKKRKAHIIAVSHSTKQDIVSLLDIDPTFISVIHEALPMQTLQISATMTEERHATLYQKLGLGTPYILAVGTREPRKNLEKLIEAWKPLAKDISLLIAGEKGWDESNVGTLPNLRFLGKVTDQELHVLYEEAELVAYPSLDEGFGLPILEAFHHGTPVVTGNSSAMPEVAGNAAVLVDAKSTDSIRAGISTILNESQSQQKKRLQQMIIRLQAFSWRQVALESRKVYQRAILSNS